jgi:spore maturation protein SpmB
VSAPAPRLLRRLRISGLLVSLGLAIEAVTMAWSHPTAFLVFLLLGGMLAGAGVLTFLATIATLPPPTAEDRPGNGA